MTEIVKVGKIDEEFSDLMVEYNLLDNVKKGKFKVIFQMMADDNEQMIINTSSKVFWEKARKALNITNDSDLLTLVCKFAKLNKFPDLSAVVAGSTIKNKKIAIPGGFLNRESASIYGIDLDANAEFAAECLKMMQKKKNHRLYQPRIDKFKETFKDILDEISRNAYQKLEKKSPGSLKEVELVFPEADSDKVWFTLATTRGFTLPKEYANELHAANTIQLTQGLFKTTFRNSTVFHNNSRICKRAAIIKHCVENGYSDKLVDITRTGQQNREYTIVKQADIAGSENVL